MRSRSQGPAPAKSRRKHHKHPTVHTFTLPLIHRSFKVEQRTLASVGALAIGAIGILAANLVGAGEMAVGGLLAYATYRVIRYGVSPTEAFAEGIELEEGEAPLRRMPRRNAMSA